MKPAPIKFCSQISYNMVLIYLGLKIWSHKTFKPPPPFQAGYGNQESNVLKKTLIKDMKIRGGQNLTAIIILSPYIIWCENQKGEQYFATIISQRGYGNQRWGGRNISQKPLALL